MFLYAAANSCISRMCTVISSRVEEFVEVRACTAPHYYVQLSAEYLLLTRGVMRAHTRSFITQGVKALPR